VDYTAHALFHDTLTREARAFFRRLNSTKTAASLCLVAARVAHLARGRGADGHVKATTTPSCIAPKKIFGGGALLCASIALDVAIATAHAALSPHAFVDFPKMCAIAGVIELFKGEASLVCVVQTIEALVVKSSGGRLTLSGLTT
jgi:hypothetical protein